MKFTVEEAINYSNEGKIEEWMQCFLRDDKENFANPNIALADGLNLEERFYYGPVLFDLDKITPKRIEKDLLGGELDWYNKVVERMSSDFNGENFPPLILEYKDEKLYLTDGNHRYSSLKSLGVNKYYVIIWGNKNKEQEFFETFKYNNKGLK